MIPTLKDVAELAGVSRSAVSRTFTKGASVSSKMRRKVENAARELGYSPNALASSLTTGRTKLIGLVANNFANPIFLEVFDLFTKMQLFRNHGVTRNIDLMTKRQEGKWYYEQIDIGFNYRMTDLQAALGMSQLAKLDYFVTARRDTL